VSLIAVNVLGERVMNSRSRDPQLAGSELQSTVWVWLRFVMLMGLIRFRWDHGRGVFAADRPHCRWQHLLKGNILQLALLCKTPHSSGCFCINSKERLPQIREPDLDGLDSKTVEKIQQLSKVKERAVQIEVLVGKRERSVKTHFLQDYQEAKRCKELIQHLKQVGKAPGSFFTSDVAEHSLKKLINPEHFRYEHRLGM